MSRLRWLWCFLILPLILGCGEETESDRLSLPPKQAVSLNLAPFGGIAVSAPSAPADSNFAAATRHVVQVNLAIGLPLATPLRLLQGAWDVEPVETDQGADWKYPMFLQEVPYECRLEGVEGASDTQWRFFVSSQALGLEEFQWIEGSTAADNRSGRWRFIAPGTMETAILADWQISASDEVEILFTQQNRESEQYALLVTYRVTPGPQGDLISLHLQYPMGQTATIRWNDLSNAGSIQASDYNEGRESCWDGDLRNLICE